ncbi:hypothetical protein ACFXPZ_39570 [Streptomyces sp. NPDC059101]|uniref:hypothetical protein n=1 Tax=Streptomyces sp. NPDC059101 TaxID=3346728 RepID=UPI003696F57A
MYRELLPLDASFFDDEDREDAEAAGLAFLNALRRIGVELADFRLLAPCENCDNEWTFSLGQESLQGLAAMTRKVVHRLDMLEAIHQQWLIDHPQVAEADDS